MCYCDFEVVFDENVVQMFGNIECQVFFFEFEVGGVVVYVVVFRIEDDFVNFEWNGVWVDVDWGCEMQLVCGLCWIDGFCLWSRFGGCC